MSPETNPPSMSTPVPQRLYAACDERGARKLGHLALSA
ncbi:hypothetical protein ABIA39_005373 [Nocardia sp. GAS34]